MPKKPTFKHFTDIPFDISWNETAGLWELDMPADMPPLALPVVLSDRYVPGREIFYFGQKKLSEVCTILQAHLDAFRARISERIDGLPEYEVLHLDTAHVQVLGPDLAYIAERLRLSPTKLSRGLLVLTGPTAERKLSVLRSYLEKMSRNRAAPDISIEGLKPRHFQRGPIGHTSFGGRLVESLIQVLSETGIRFTVDQFGVLVLENEDLPAVAELAKTLRAKATARIAEVRKAIDQPDFAARLPAWARVYVEDDALCFDYPADLVRSNVRMGMQNRGISRSLWEKNRRHPSRLHWAVDIKGEIPTERILSSVASALRFLEAKRRDEARALERQPSRAMP